MTPPRVDAIRLTTRAAGVRPPAPPLGLSGWASDASAQAVLLDATGTDLSTVESVAAQLGDATSLPPRTLVVVLGAAVRVLPAWRRLFGGGATQVPRALRCSALLVKGYVEIGADAAGDLTWGWSSGETTATPPPLDAAAVSLS
jgi:hypothetical protein